MKFCVTLMNIVDSDVLQDNRSGTYTGKDRYECVAKAFVDLTGKKQHDVLDKWKVLDVSEVAQDEPPSTVSKE